MDKVILRCWDHRLLTIKFVNFVMNNGHQRPFCPETSTLADIDWVAPSAVTNGRTNNYFADNSRVPAPTL